MNPRPLSYQESVLPLNYPGKFFVGGAGFAPAKAKMPSGLQPDPFDYLGTHPPSIGGTEVPPRLRSARISASLQCSFRSHPLLVGRIIHLYLDFGSFRLNISLNEIVLAVTPLPYSTWSLSHLITFFGGPSGT